ncbi:MAG: transcription antitermination factor NusB [Verrucomicrobia bacterium]|nr:transcription antitermination factor NusB [Verrucomicrobiota bacterium]
MALSPQKFREVLFLLVYCHDFGSSDEVMEEVMKTLSVTKKTVREANLIQVQIAEHLHRIDAVIKAHAKAYEFDRIPGVERSVLRLGVYELLYARTVPPKVAIAEAIRLTRKFATPESAGFINAILDSVWSQNGSREHSEPVQREQTAEHALHV